MGAALVFLGLLAVMFAFPDTAAGRGLRATLVDGPARWLSRLTPRTLLLAVLTGIALVMLSQVMPVGVATALAGDLAAYMEVSIAVAALLAGANARRLLASLRDRVTQAVVSVRRRLARPRTRSHVRRPRRLPPPDAEGRPAFA